ncbi:uncharacterized protein LOC116342103 [Contarinia nasturtii]|uniref:uncharacterized protein LOC116342103 n=1 Tax=Contarinia nasturtii TaxID=265458 RepID=UPI0012D48D87|nr:uncharacterized protein LOC116342103 [Contarinia nasturtii]
MAQSKATTISSEEFQQKFGWVTCRRCFCPSSGRVILLAFVCGHVFCQKCVKVSKNDQQVLFGICGSCKKMIKCARLSERLPLSFLNRFFGPLIIETPFRSAIFRYYNWNHNIRTMFRRLQKLYRIDGNLYQSYKRRRELLGNSKREQQHYYEQARNFFTTDQVKCFLTHPIRKLEDMRFNYTVPTGQSRPGYSPYYISEDSEIPLSKQVLMKNSHSSSRSRSRSRS